MSECYYRVATRQDVELAAGMRVMDDRNTTARILKKAIEDQQPYFLFAETQQGECDREIDDMLEVCTIQEKLGGRFVWNFNQPVGHTRESGRQIRPLVFLTGWDYNCGYLTNSPDIVKIMNPKSEGFEFDEQQMVFDSAWDEVMSNLIKKGC